MAKLLKIKGKPSALFFSIFSPTFALMPRVNATVFGPRQPLLALMINILWNHMSNYFVFKQESKERIAELLGIELKEEDFECIEDFPGKLHILPVRNKRAKRAFVSYVSYECSLCSFVSSTPSSFFTCKAHHRVLCISVVELGSAKSGVEFLVGDQPFSFSHARG